MARSDWQAMDYDSGMFPAWERDHVRSVMREWANKPYRSYVIPAPRCSSWQAMDCDSGAGPGQTTDIVAPLIRTRHSIGRFVEALDRALYFSPVPQRLVEAALTEARSTLSHIKLQD